MQSSTFFKMRCFGVMKKSGRMYCVNSLQMELQNDSVLNEQRFHHIYKVSLIAVNLDSDTSVLRPKHIIIHRPTHFHTHLNSELRSLFHLAALKKLPSHDW